MSAVHPRVEPEELARHADARALAARPGPGTACSRRRVFRRRRADAGSRGSLPARRAEQDGGVAHRAGHGPRRVLAVGDGDDPGPAHQAQRRLEADDPVGRRTGTRSSRPSPCRWPPRRGSRTPPPPEPELEPQGLRSSTYGFRHCPPRALHPLLECVERMLAHSLRFVLPRRTAPAARSRRDDEGVARGAIEPSRASEPAVVVLRSPVSTLSLSSTGMPCSGPRGPFARRSASSASARARASGLTSRTLAQLGPAAVEGLDAVEVGPGQLARREAARRHLLLEVRDGRLRELERRR